MDTIPNRRYYRNGRRADGSYPCLECPYADNKTCSSCIFAKWNVEGILAGFSPKEAYRQSHQCDVGASPLLQQINKTPTPLELGSPVNQVLPKVNLPFFPVPSYNSMSESLSKLNTLRRKIGG